VVCDEGHGLRDINTHRSKFVFALVADIKWIVTGTPITTEVKDLKNLMKFVGLEESDKMFSVIDHVGLTAGYKLLFYLMRPLLIRHSQAQTYKETGTTLMSLPPMSERVLECQFSRKESEEFNKLEREAQAFYLNFRWKHAKDMSKHFLKVSSKLIKLRIACAGGRYPLDDASQVIDEEATEADETKEATTETKKATKSKTNYSEFVFESKFKVLLQQLKIMRDEEPDAKSLVFSQFASSLEYLQEELPKHGFSYRTMKGSMSKNQRAKALNDFQNDPPTTIFLLSTRSAACGINLTQANRVFLLEPSFNPALEAQAIGRVHRLGQKRKVEIVRLVIANSFESRVMSFLQKKYKLSFADASSLQQDRDSSDVDGNDEQSADIKDNKHKSGKKNVAKVVNEVCHVVDCITGNLSKEKALIMTEEFDELFGIQDRLNEDVV
jgi:SNF2 family DNA or RNA helicase